MSEACTIRLTGRANSRCGAGDRKGTRAETTGRWHRRERESALQGSRGVRSRTAGASRTPGRARRPAQRRGAVEERRGRTSATYCGPSASVKGIQGEVWEVNQRKVRGGAALALTNALRYHAARTNQRRGGRKRRRQVPTHVDKLPRGGMLRQPRNWHRTVCRGYPGARRWKNQAPGADFRGKCTRAGRPRTPGPITKW